MMVGTPGAVGAVGAAGVTVTAAETALVPMALVAVAVQVYAVPLISPLIVMGSQRWFP